LGVVIYFQTGFATVWRVYGGEWLEKALYVPTLSPIYKHLILATTNSLPVQTDFGYGLTVPGKKFDLYLYDRYGLLSIIILLAIVSVILLMIHRTFQGTKNMGRKAS
jgi:hypothetical protein